MATITRSIQHKRDTAANFTANNPTLLAGQLGIETDGLTTTPKFKIGDGVTAWNTLPYATSSGGGTWGSITGTLSNQTDLQTALDAKQDEATVISGNTTAANDGVYHVVASATFTDPTPAEGKGYTVFVRNGTATVGATAYAVAGTIIKRIYHSGAWANYISGTFQNLTTNALPYASSATTLADSNLKHKSGGVDLLSGKTLGLDGADVHLDFGTTASPYFELGLDQVGMYTKPYIYADEESGIEMYGPSGNTQFNMNAGGGFSIQATGSYSVQATSLVLESGTELNYVDGTASTIAHFDSNKDLKSLDTATYPNLSELAYVKGVTGAIQTQLGTKIEQNLGRSGNTIIIGGTSTTGTLTLRATSGVGTTGADIIFQGGNNGATEFARFEHAGNLLIGSASNPTGFDLNLSKSKNNFVSITAENTSSGTAAFACLTLVNNVAALADIFQYRLYSSGFTTAGLIVARQGHLRCTANAGFLVSTNNGSIIYSVGGTAATNDVMRQTTTGVIFNGGTGATKVTTATGYITIAAGLAAAGQAPLKFTAGTNNTTAEAGAMEYNGTDLFFTKSGTTRATVLCATAATTESVASDTTLTITYAGTTYKLLARA